MLLAKRVGALGVVCKEKLAGGTVNMPTPFTRLLFQTMLFRYQDVVSDCGSRITREVDGKNIPTK